MLKIEFVSELLMLLLFLFFNLFIFKEFFSLNFVTVNKCKFLLILFVFVLNKSSLLSKSFKSEKSFIIKFSMSMSFSFILL